MPNSSSESELARRLAGTPYDAYVYAYPHKTAYGPLVPARPLDEAWKDEDKRALSLYIHVPFCEMRCGFCNLFTTPRPAAETVARYVATLERQAAQVSAALGDATYARFALGGGTPTLLDPDALERVLDLVPNGIPGSVETSPETCSPDRMRLLRQRGIDRVSIGVQSFLESESAGVNRPQKYKEVFAALDTIRAAGIPTLNIDLIYGLPEQTAVTWEQSLRTALEWAPEELYLYPLYVRPVTTLSKRPGAWDDERLALYRLARNWLRDAGYEQVSMRMFQKSGAEKPVYCVQDEGMVGLGPGARSYTRALHYSTEWAVGARGVQAILGDWLGEESFAVARWGIELDLDEQRRRWMAYSLFTAQGMDLSAFTERFGAFDFDELTQTGAAVRDGHFLKLTDFGMERSDTIGPWLYSDVVRAKMRAFAVR